MAQAVPVQAVRQTPQQFADTLGLDASEKKAFKDAANDIARSYTANQALMSTSVFRSSSGELFDPTFVSTYSSYVVPPPVNESGEPDRSTELVCRNAILSLLGNNVNIIHMFLLKLLRSCKSSVGPTYAVSSMKNALLGTPGYDVVFQVRLDEIHNLVDDSVFSVSDTDWVASASTAGNSTGDEGYLSDSASVASVDSVDLLPLEPMPKAIRPKKLYSAIDHDPAKDDESYAGLSITQDLSRAFLESSSSSIEEFFTKINQLTNPDEKVNALLGSIVGFLITQISECRYPLFLGQPSVNLVCADIIDGIAGSGQALIVIFLMAALMKGFARVCLELASNVMNIAGLCLYSKFFKVDYRLLHEYHAGTLFYDPGNLPMSMEFSEIDAFLQQQRLPLTLDNKLNYIILLCTRSPNKHPLCSIGMVPIQIQVGPNLVDIASAQREAAATQFMLYLVETIGICITTGVDAQWRDGKIFKDLIASAVRNAIALEDTLHTGVAGKIPGDLNSALRSKYFCDKLQQAVIVDPSRFTKDNCWSGRNPAREIFHLDRTCIKMAIDAASQLSLSRLHGELTTYLGTIYSTHGPATIQAAREKKRVADAAAAADAAAGNPPKLSATDLRIQRLQMRNDKKAKEGSAATTPLAAHAPYAPPTFSALGLHQLQQQVVGALPASFPLASPPSRPSKSRNSLAIQAATASIQNEQTSVRAKGPYDQKNTKEAKQQQLANKQAKEEQFRMLKYQQPQQKREPGMGSSGGKKQTKNKRKKNKPKTKRRAANKKNKKAHAGRVSRHNKVFRRKTRKSK